MDEARAQLDEAESKQKARPMEKPMKKGGRFKWVWRWLESPVFLLVFLSLEKSKVIQMILMSILADVDSCM